MTLMRVGENIQQITLYWLARFSAVSIPGTGFLSNEIILFKTAWDKLYQDLSDIWQWVSMVTSGKFWGCF